MGLGILEARDGFVPGTTVVLDQKHGGDIVQGEESLPRGLKYDGDIILVPQPSDDPNDPLNWPLWKRDFILFILCLISVIASTLSPLLAAYSLTLVLYYGTDFQQVALLTGYHLLAVGLSGFLFVASARKWGKRHLYLIGTVFIIIGSAWGGSSGTNKTSLVWARVFQGIGLAPFEALVNASVGDLYFVHQRGLRMAVSNMALFGGAFATPIVAGRIAHVLGWKWTLYLVAIFAAALLPLVILFVPETAYRRPEVLNTDYTGNHTEYRPAANISSEISAAERQAVHINGAGIVRSEPSADSGGLVEYYNQAGILGDKPSAGGTKPKKTLLQTLSPFDGRKTDENFFKLVFRPLPLFLHPGVLWSCLIQGTLIGWTVLIGVVLAAIFLGPPLWLNEQETGLLYTGPFVGAIVGFILAGSSDFVTKFMIRRNRGVYEPEFRIVLVALQLIIGCAGLYGFGYVSENVKPNGQFLPAFFFALEVCGMVIGAVASALYIVDAHREIAVEAFTCMLIFKNIFSFGITYGAYGWLVREGPAKIFVIIASLQIGICLLSVPMYVFGKRNRAFMHRYNILKMVGLW